MVVFEDMVSYVYKRTTEGSSLRKLLTIVAVDSAVADPGAHDFVEGALKAYGDFAPDFARQFALQSRPGAKKLPSRPACDFHQHKMTKRCDQ